MKCICQTISSKIGEIFQNILRIELLSVTWTQNVKLSLTDTKIDLGGQDFNADYDSWLSSM